MQNIVNSIRLYNEIILYGLIRQGNQFYIWTKIKLNNLKTIKAL